MFVIANKIFDNSNEIRNPFSVQKKSGIYARSLPFGRDDKFCNKQFKLLEQHNISNATKIYLHFCLCHFSIYFIEKPRLSPNMTTFFDLSIKKRL